MTTTATDLAKVAVVRFVFAISGTSNEILNGSDVEVSAETLEEAEKRTAYIKARWGGEVQLIGRREGFRSTSCFVPLAPLSDIPAHIVQNERFGGFTLDGRVAEDARRAELGKRLEVA